MKMYDVQIEIEKDAIFYWVAFYQDGSLIRMTTISNEVAIDLLKKLK